MGAFDASEGAGGMGKGGQPPSPGDAAMALLNRIVRQGQSGYRHGSETGASEGLASDGRASEGRAGFVDPPPDRADPEQPLAAENAANAGSEPRLSSCGVGIGTRVVTLDGLIPVEFLGPGDRVVTRSGARPVRAVHCRPGVAMVVAPGALGRACPEAALVLGLGTPILWQGGARQTPPLSEGRARSTGARSDGRTPGDLAQSDPAQLSARARLERILRQPCASHPPAVPPPAACMQLPAARIGAVLGRGGRAGTAVARHDQAPCQMLFQLEFDCAEAFFAEGVIIGSLPAKADSAP